MTKRSRRLRRSNLKFRRRTAPGASPGSVVVDPTAAHPVVRVISYGPDDVEVQEVSDLSQLGALVGRRPVTWVHVQGLGDAKTIKTLGKVFKLHPLALEDVVNTHQRAKVEDYGDCLFIVSRTVMPGQRLETEQVAMFLGKDFVVTFQEGPLESLETIETRIRKAGSRLRRLGADYLAYTVLDAVIDAYFPALEQYGEWLERIDDEISTRANRDVVGRIHDLRGELLMLRRAIWPLRDAVGALTREAYPLISEETRFYLRDGYDHTLQIMELIETCREMCADLREYSLSMINTKMSEVMKVLTIIATIFIPLGFVAGVYGMNFDPHASRWNMPELRWLYGYPFVLGLMVAIAVGMLVFFWRRGWLRP